MALLLGEGEQPVAERLGAVVERELAGPVGAGGVVDAAGASRRPRS